MFTGSEIYIKTYTIDLILFFAFPLSVWFWSNDNGRFSYRRSVSSN